MVLDFCKILRITLSKILLPTLIVNKQNYTTFTYLAEVREKMEANQNLYCLNGKH